MNIGILTKSFNELNLTDKKAISLDFKKNHTGSLVLLAIMCYQEYPLIELSEICKINPVLKDHFADEIGLSIGTTYGVSSYPL